MKGFLGKSAVVVVLAIAATWLYTKWNNPGLFSKSTESVSYNECGFLAFVDTEADRPVYMLMSMLPRKDVVIDERSITRFGIRFENLSIRPKSGPSSLVWLTRTPKLVLITPNGQMHQGKCEILHKDFQAAQANFWKARDRFQASGSFLSTEAVYKKHGPQITVNAVRAFFEENRDRSWPDNIVNVIRCLEPNTP